TGPMGRPPNLLTDPHPLRPLRPPHRPPNSMGPRTQRRRPNPMDRTRTRQLQPRSRRASRTLGRGALHARWTTPARTTRTHHPPTPAGARPGDERPASDDERIERPRKSKAKVKPKATWGVDRGRREPN